MTVCLVSVYNNLVKYYGEGENMKECIQCGAMLSDSAEFCKYCGVSLAENSIPQEATVLEQTAPVDFVRQAEEVPAVADMPVPGVFDEPQEIANPEDATKNPTRRVKIFFI